MVVEGGDSWHSVARVQMQRKYGFINSATRGKNYSILGSVVVGKTAVF